MKELIKHCYNCYHENSPKADFEICNICSDNAVYKNIDCSEWKVVDINIQRNQFYIEFYDKLYYLKIYKKNNDYNLNDYYIRINEFIIAANLFHIIDNDERENLLDCIYKIFNSKSLVFK